VSLIFERQRSQILRHVLQRPDVVVGGGLRPPVYVGDEGRQGGCESMQQGLGHTGTLAMACLAAGDPLALRGRADDRNVPFVELLRRWPAGASLAP